MQLFTDWGVSLSDAFNQGLGIEIIKFIPKLAFAVIIFIAGWVVGLVLGEIIEKIVNASRIDRLLESDGAKNLLNKAGFNLNTGAFLGGLVKWFIIIGFLVAALDVFQLQAVNALLSMVVMQFIPNIIIASLILIVGAFLAEFVQKITSGAAKAVDVKSSGFVGGIARWAIWVFTIIAALMQLHIADQILSTLVTGLVAMLALAGGLSFGLGGKDAASRFIEKLRGDISNR
ncbi:MAG: hypothetical protein HY228_03130 [Candidatus Yonathbacteria bacterium]|nr:hypothetical protein [Candidatus Yonathbacteria bacterium]